MIHFDIPWSLMTFSQRNGRIDRYGQNERPEIYYMMVNAGNEKIRGDRRVLELLIEKGEEAQRSIKKPKRSPNSVRIQNKRQGGLTGIENVTRSIADGYEIFPGLFLKLLLKDTCVGCRTWCRGKSTTLVWVKSSGLTPAHPSQENLSILGISLPIHLVVPLAGARVGKMEKNKISRVKKAIYPN